MGWKSTIDITREQAISSIVKAQSRQKIDPFMYLSNEKLEEMMYDLDIGDDMNLDYFGHDFIIHNTQEEIDRIKKEEEEDFNKKYLKK